MSRKPLDAGYSTFRLFLIGALVAIFALIPNAIINLFVIFWRDIIAGHPVLTVLAVLALLVLIFIITGWAAVMGIRYGGGQRR